MPQLTDHRVLFQYLDPAGHSHFEFTTVLAESPETAGLVIRSAHADDISLSIIQTVESNGEPTGFTDEQIVAAIAAGEATDHG